MKNACRQSGIHVVPAYIFIASKKSLVCSRTPLLRHRSLKCPDNFGPRYLYMRKWREREREVEKDEKRNERSWCANLVRRKRYSSSRRVTVWTTRPTSTVHLARVSFVGGETITKVSSLANIRLTRRAIYYNIRDVASHISRTKNFISLSFSLRI